MSSGPPHQPSAWNHLQVPNFYPRHPPQHAHMSAEPPPPPPPTWHTPTTEPLKVTPPPPIFSLEQMLTGAGSDRQYPKSAGVDLSLSKTNNQNGDVAMTTAPISLSVRDTNKINSLLEMGAGEVTPKRPSKVDAILERLNPEGAAQPVAPSHDENSNSSSTGNTPVEGGESRRKRKPTKTMKVTQPEVAEEPQKIPERRRSSDDALSGETPVKVRRKASSESETIDNIAAMIHETSDNVPNSAEGTAEPVRPISVSVIKTIDAAVTTTKANYVEVEDKLEEMFAGIEDDSPKKDEETTKEAVTSTSGDVPKKTATKTKRKAGKDAKKVKKPTTPTKKAGKPKKPEHVAATRDTDSGRSAKGPFVQIRGPRDSPLSVAVVNAPSAGDDEKKKYHDDSEYRHKVRTNKLATKGLHSSTLSNQYDAQTKDSTWVCAFCKKGPHSGAALPNGDLFGPYFISTQSPEYERRHSEDPFEKQFKSRKITKALEMGNKKRLKQRRSASEDVHLGIVPVTTMAPSQNSNNNGSTSNNHFEVWAHEDCIVWSTGTYLIGARIVGLEEAVWNSCEVRCDMCQNKGANICCVRRGCVKVSHVGCARDSDWLLDEDTYKTYCAEHAPSQ